MTRSFKIATATVAMTGLATPALAHVGEHSHASSAHFLVEHGLMIGLASLAVIAGVAFYLRNKA